MAKLTRRVFLKRCAAGTAVVLGGCCVEAFGVGRRWVDINHVRMPIQNLPDGLVGKKIAHITDLHLTKDATPKEFLISCMEKVNSLNPDLTVITGDLVTYNTKGIVEELEEVLSHLKSPNGVFGCLGNHDIVIRSKLTAGKTRFSKTSFTFGDTKFLVNSSEEIQIGNEKLQIVGVGDSWTNNVRADLAYEDVNSDSPVITLLHNPDDIKDIKDQPTDAILCGHTHGGQVRIPLFGALFLPLDDKKYDWGEFEVNDKFIYVNRGLGTLGNGKKGSFRFNCRPEISVYEMVKKV